MHKGLRFKDHIETRKSRFLNNMEKKSHYKRKGYWVPDLRWGVFAVLNLFLISDLDPAKLIPLKSQEKSFQIFLPTIKEKEISESRILIFSNTADISEISRNDREIETKKGVEISRERAAFFSSSSPENSQILSLF